MVGEAVRLGERHEGREEGHMRRALDTATTQQRQLPPGLPPPCRTWVVGEERCQLVDAAQHHKRHRVAACGHRSNVGAHRRHRAAVGQQRLGCGQHLSTAGGGEGSTAGRAAGLWMGFFHSVAVATASGHQAALSGAQPRAQLPTGPPGSDDVTAPLARSSMPASYPAIHPASQPATASPPGTPLPCSLAPSLQRRPSRR